MYNDRRELQWSNLHVLKKMLVSGTILLELYMIL